MLLQEAIDTFKQYLITMDKSPETVRGYISDLYNFGRYLEETYNCPLYLDEIKTTDIENYLYYLKEKKQLQTASRSRALYTLRSFWSYACKKELSSSNITLAVEPLKIRTKERTYLSSEEASQLIDTIDHPLVKVVIQTLFFTGMRITECLNLTIEDVNLEKNRISVINGKGKKDRKIPINQHLLPILDHYLKHIRPDVNSTLFFATQKTGKLSSVYVNHILHNTVKKLGWDKHVTAHILRHSFASNLIKNGVNLVYVQKLLGHSNLKVTSVYTHADMNDLDDAINVL